MRIYKGPAPRNSFKWGNVRWRLGPVISQTKKLKITRAIPYSTSKTYRGKK